MQNISITDILYMGYYQPKTTGAWQCNSCLKYFDNCNSYFIKNERICYSCYNYLCFNISVKTNMPQENLSILTENFNKLAPELIKKKKNTSKHYAEQFTFKEILIQSLNENSKKNNIKNHIS